MSATEDGADSIALGDGESVSVGDEFLVILPKRSLLPGKPTLGDVLTVVDIKRDVPDAPRLKVSYSSGSYQTVGMSPTSLAEALCLVSYKHAPTAPCLEKRV